MKVTVTLNVPELSDAPPPFVRLRRAIKYLLRSHRITVLSVKPVKPESTPSISEIVAFKSAVS